MKRRFDKFSKFVKSTLVNSGSSRFEYIEAQAPKPLKEMTLAEMDVLWEEAKRGERAEV